jgi:hypothetical protein
MGLRPLRGISPANCHEYSQRHDATNRDWVQDGTGKKTIESSDFYLPSGVRIEYDPREIARCSARARCQETTSRSSRFRTSRVVVFV